MKKILVPTDFSENANQALNYAIQFANQIGGTVCVLHTYQASAGAGQFISVDTVIQEDREKELYDLISKVKPLLAANASIESYVKKGGAVETICLAAQKLNIDIIIMGTTGASGMKKIFMGSTASHVIKNTTLPVLAIPNDFHNFQISNITLALDNNKVESADVLRPLIDLIKTFGTTLNLLIVVEDASADMDIDDQLQEHIKAFGVSYTYFKLNAASIGQGIQEFITRKNSDMLCVLHHTHGWFQDIFHASIAQQMAFDSKVPLFVLRG